MPMVVLEEIEQIRAGFLKYTREAFLRLPRLENPRILDVGCGSGVPTIELAKLSDGEVTGIDIDKSCIDEFNRKIKKEELSNRVEALNLSLFEMKFPDETFDVVWSEGVIGKIGFETSLKEWRRLLKHNGYLVIHYQISRVADALPRIPQHGYSLADTVQLPADAWWTEFYKPIEEKMDALLHKYRNNSDALKLLEKYKSEMHMVKKNPSNFSAAFYIMKKV
ncbi:methyltransferase domain-containing protein [Candidatus Bathyarchaeota archaeon]|nr:methyltransferase domain-containing protein [Candidatus Bathyarchaeota archaeon]